MEINIKTPKEREFPLLAKRKPSLGTLYVLFLSNVVGIKLTITEQGEHLSFRPESWTNCFDSTIWEILPLGYTIEIKI